jgi:hypothetical protein
VSVLGVDARGGAYGCELRRRTRALLVAIEGFVGVGALFGGYQLMSDAEGFGVEETWLEGTPFSSYAIPGLVLFAVIGGGMLAAAALAALGSRYAALAAFLIGFTLVGFLTVETLLMGYQGAKQIRLVAMVAIPALVMIAVGWSAQVHAARRPTHTGRGEAIGG